MNGLTILRRVDNIDEFARQSIVLDGHLFEMQDGKAYVDNDQPWDAEIARYIHEATIDYILVDNDFKTVAGPFRDLTKAVAARKGAKVTFVAEVELDDDESALVEAAAASV